jgi:ribosome modulation factor
MVVGRDNHNKGVTPESIERAKLEGAQAYATGRSIGENPYPYSNKQWRAWEQSFLKAKREHKRGPKSE